MVFRHLSAGAVVLFSSFFSANGARAIDWSLDTNYSPASGNGTCTISPGFAVEGLFFVALKSTDGADIAWAVRPNERVRSGRTFYLLANNTRRSSDETIMGFDIMSDVLAESPVHYDYVNRSDEIRQSQLDVNGLAELVRQCEAFLFSR